MPKMVKIKHSLTEKGSVQHEKSGKALVEFFRSAASQRAAVKAGTDNLLEMFLNSYVVDRENTMRVLFHLRACRKGGSGERAAFRKILDAVFQTAPNFILDNMDLILDCGYWKDILHIVNQMPALASGVISDASIQSRWSVCNQLLDKWAEKIKAKDYLATKWCPRFNQKNDKVATIIKNKLGITNKEFRKLLKETSKTVENQMCRQEWDKINYSQVPGIAMTKYVKAFPRHDKDRFTTWKTSGEKANASVLYPHTIVATLEKDAELADKQWQNLPNYIKTDENILPMVDTSGSMNSNKCGESKLTCMDVAVALGLYLSERLAGKFKNKFVTFSSNPEFQIIEGKTLKDRVHSLSHAGWSQSTNFEAAYDMILHSAKMWSIEPKDMPTMLVILSDMQFDGVDKPITHLSNMEQKFTAAGYKLPKMVFWNLREAYTGSPATARKDGVAMIPGFSPSVMEAVFACKQEFTPLAITMEAIKRFQPVFNNMPKKLELRRYIENYKKTVVVAVEESEDE